MRGHLWRLLALVGVCGLAVQSPFNRPRLAAAGPARAAAAEWRYPSLFPMAPAVGEPLRRIEVSLARQELVTYEGLVPVRAAAVSTGDWEHPTILGRFSLSAKFDQIDLVGADYYYPAVPYVMQFARPFYIHAAPWRAEFGVAASRGCVTLSTADAAWLYAWAPLGIPVIIRW